MYYCPIHKLYRLALCLLILSLACTKEKVLKIRGGDPDKGQVFVVGYINNNRSSIDNKLVIYGKDLPDMGIEAWIDSGTGYSKLILKYVTSQAYVNFPELHCDMQKIKFRPYQYYKFKVTSAALNDFIEMEKALPDTFGVAYTLSYPTPQEYNLQVKVVDNGTNKEKYVHDLSGARMTDTNSLFPKINTTHYYSSYDLPSIMGLGGNAGYNKELVELNRIDIYNYFRYPFIYDFMGSCSYAAFNDNLRTDIIRFSKEDFEYMTSARENMENFGNPFFLFYQLKHLEKSSSGKMLGKMVSSYLATTPFVNIHDRSDTAIKVIVKDKNGNNIIGDPKYKDVGKYGYGNYEFNIDLRKGRNCYFMTFTTLDYYRSPCSPYKNKLYKEDKLYTFEYQAKEISTGKVYVTNKVTTDLSNLPKVIELQIQ